MNMSFKNIIGWF